MEPSDSVLASSFFTALIVVEDIKVGKAVGDSAEEIGLRWCQSDHSGNDPGSSSADGHKGNVGREDFVPVHEDFRFQKL